MRIPGKLYSTDGSQFGSGKAEEKPPGTGGTGFSRFLYYFFFLGTIIPMQIMPTIRLFTVLDIYGGYLNVIILYSAINIPFSCFLYTGFIKGIPRVLDESAFIEGASAVQVYFRIILPLLKPCNITVLMDALVLGSDMDNSPCIAVICLFILNSPVVKFKSPHFRASISPRRIPVPNSSRNSS